MVYFRCLHIERSFLIKVVFTKRVQGVWWVQPFRKHWMLSFKTAKMTFNSEKAQFYVFLQQYIIPFASLMCCGGGSPDPKDPPWIRPCRPTNPYGLAVSLTISAAISRSHLSFFWFSLGQGCSSLNFKPLKNTISRFFIQLQVGRPDSFKYIVTIIAS